MIISKTPLRVSFAGGATDLRSYYKHNKYGAVLSTSINKYLYVTVKKHCELFEEKIRLNYSTSELTNNIENIKTPPMDGYTITKHDGTGRFRFKNKNCYI